MAKIIELKLGRNGDEPLADDVETARVEVGARLAALVEFASQQAAAMATFMAFERGLIPLVFALA